MSSPRAACITPPAIGGIAVVQVVGRTAAALISRHLHKAGKSVDLSEFSSNELRLCRLMDGEETLDDVLVCVRHAKDGSAVVDLNLHGGPRVVQRTLMMLQSDGVKIVDAGELLQVGWPARNLLVADAIALLPQALTRHAAVWLAGLPERLEAELRTIIALIRQSETAVASRRLSLLQEAARPVNTLIRGARVVLLGSPNSGKSTLANALAQREHAIVSPTPGTTRDWTEHPVAVEGVPFTIVDTAGLRTTRDPIEQEAIRRAIQQCEGAEVILQVIDTSAPPVASPLPAAMARRPAALLTVYNKCDLPMDPAWAARLELCSASQADQPQPLRISAAAGDGLDRLGASLQRATGVAPGQPWPVAPFSTQQLAAVREASESLGSAHDRTAAVDLLEKLVIPLGQDGSASDTRV